MNQNKNILLKIALLSCAVVTASINAIAGNIPAIAESFSDVPVHIIELITTIPSLSMMIAILCSSLISGVIGNKRTVLIGLLLCGLGGVAPYLSRYNYYDGYKTTFWIWSWTYLLNVINNDYLFL